MTVYKKKELKESFQKILWHLTTRAHRVHLLMGLWELRRLDFLLWYTAGSGTLDFTTGRSYFMIADGGIRIGNNYSFDVVGMAGIDPSTIKMMTFDPSKRERARRWSWNEEWAMSNDESMTVLCEVCFLYDWFHATARLERATEQVWPQWQPVCNVSWPQHHNTTNGKWKMENGELWWSILWWMICRLWWCAMSLSSPELRSNCDEYHLWLYGCIHINININQFSSCSFRLIGWLCHHRIQ